MININFFSKVNTAPTKEINEYSQSKEDLQRILDRLYKCRDLEITNLWQRSVFLSVFLILCFTAHGYLLLETYSKSSAFLINLLTMGFVLSFIGIIMSIIWICMAKASKAWYEVYEEAIIKFEETHHKILGIPEENIMGNMTIEKNDLDVDIYSRNGGSFSPSKINIIIGQVCFFWWLFNEMFYLTTIVTHLSKNNDYIIISVVVIFIMILAIFLIKFQGWIKSGFLSKQK